jgi:RNA polymerase sigma-70 factor (ECF subfamily)
MRDGSDDELMRRAGRGDRAAFSTLVARHLSRATALATRVTGNRSDADELVQEAFLRAWLKAPEWQSQEEAARGASFNTWFSRVLVNLCIDRRRRPVSAPIEAAEHAEATEPGGFDTTFRREISGRVLAALGELPARQRAALTLCHWDERTNIEAAQILDISVGALESLLVRARRAMRDALTDLAPETAMSGDIAQGGRK